MNHEPLKELLLQSLEYERVAVRICDAALTCVGDRAVRKELHKQGRESQKHERVLCGLLVKLRIDPNEETPGRSTIRRWGSALVQVIQRAQYGTHPAATELVVCECVLLATVKGTPDWNLLRLCAPHAMEAVTEALSGPVAPAKEQAKRLSTSSLTSKMKPFSGSPDPRPLAAAPNSLEDYTKH
jgi:hypothetical protein